MSHNDLNGNAIGQTGSGMETTARLDRDDLVRGWREYEARTPRVVPCLKYSARTDMGQVRENNEDKFDSYEPEIPSILVARGSLFAVADGIGGAQAGQIASELVLKSLIAGYYDHPAPDLETALREAILATNERIYSLAQMIPERSGMGATLTAAVFVEGRVVVAQVGDSRGYRIRDGAIQQVTQDHSWVEEQVRAGQMSRSDAGNSPFRNVITRSVGASAVVEPDLYEDEARPGDIWVLCSDGLTEYVQDAEIAQIAGRVAPAEATRQFIDLANARGGRDNITVFVIAVRDLRDFASCTTSDSERIDTLPAHYLAGPERDPRSSVAPDPAPMSAAPSPRGVAPRAGWRKIFGR